jgi:hypothetical protein
MDVVVPMPSGRIVFNRVREMGVKGNEKVCVQLVEWEFCLALGSNDPSNQEVCPTCHLRRFVPICRAFVPQPIA